MKPSSDATLIDVGSARLECRRFGSASSPALVVEAGLACSMGEWFHLAERLAAEWQVILYSRAGYGASGPSCLPRTPLNVAAELDALLQAVVGDRQVTIIGHSYGGLVVQALVRAYPLRVAKAVFIDPMTFQDHKFLTVLNPAEYAASGVDKSVSLRTAKALCRLGLGWLFRPLLRRSPPFYYWPDFSPEASRTILRNATRYQMYRQALEEYRLAREPLAGASLPSGEACFDGELVLFVHHSAGMVQDIMHFGATDAATAAKVEELWQTYMREVLDLSCHSRRVQSQSGSHHLHLTDAATLMGFLGR